MFCSNCGEKLEDGWNICTNCGARVENKNVVEHKNYVPANQPTYANVPNNQRTPKSFKDKVWSIVSIVFFVLLNIVFFRYHCNILVIISVWVVEIADFIIHQKKVNQKSIIYKAVDVVCCVVFALSLINLYDCYQNTTYIELVHSYGYREISFKELFDDLSNSPSWECVEREPFTVTDVNDTGIGGSYEAMVNVSGDCLFYEEETDYTLTFYVSKENERVVPAKVRIGENNYNELMASLFILGVLKNYAENNQMPVYSDDNANNSGNYNSAWYYDYESCWNEEHTIQLMIWSQNDSGLYVRAEKLNGESIEFDVDIEPDYIGETGELIYSSVAGSTLIYYPSGYVYITTPDISYQDVYYPEN